MKVKLNGNNFDFKLEDEKHIGEILGKIEAACKAEKTTITKVLIDGNTLNSKELDALFQKPVSEDISLELFTTSGAEVRAFMNELGKKFIKNSEEMENVSVKMQTGKDGEVIALVEEFTLNLQDFYGAVRLSDITGISEEQKFGDKSISEYHTELLAKLNTILTAIENKDSVEISDIAEYELSPLAKDLGNGLLSIQV
ncbi:hypothetical protein [Treponema pedis]|uniref:hypothetical protein n=1 Tax=Treponema pedis TaxID=409322 RepID=UPI000429D949|nr:hypothetical protein [Treponema pedis]